MPKEQAGLARFMESVGYCVQAYFSGYVGEPVRLIGCCEEEAETIALRDVTAVIDVTGPVHVLVACSYDMSLLQHLFKMEAAGLAIGEEERNAFLLDTAAETLNIILGHCTASLAEEGRPLALSPPLVMKEERELHRPRGTIAASRTFDSAKGRLGIIVIGTGNHLFSDTTG